MDWEFVCKFSVTVACSELPDGKAGFAIKGLELNVLRSSLLSSCPAPDESILLKDLDLLLLTLSAAKSANDAMFTAKADLVRKGCSNWFSGRGGTAAMLDTDGR